MARGRALAHQADAPGLSLEVAKAAADLADQRVLVVSYARPLAHRPNVYAGSDVPPAQVNLVNVQLPDWLRRPSPQFLYLWTGHTNR